MTRYWTILSITILGLTSLLTSRSQGALVPGVETLADLLTRGDVTVGDIRYYDFAYGYRGLTAPTPSQVRVDAPADGLGLTLSANWTSLVDGAQSITLQFRVAAGVSLNHFKSVTTTMTGRSAATSGSGRASVVDAVTPDSGSPTTTYNALRGDATTVGTLNITSMLPEFTTDLMVVKTIDVRSTGMNFSEMSTVSTIFTPIHLPEPAGLILASAALLSLRRGRRR